MDRNTWTPVESERLNVADDGGNTAAALHRQPYGPEVDIDPKIHVDLPSGAVPDSPDRESAGHGARAGHGIEAGLNGGVSIDLGERERRSDTGRTGGSLRAGRTLASCWPWRSGRACQPLRTRDAHRSLGTDLIPRQQHLVVRITAVACGIDDPDGSTAFLVAGRNHSVRARDARVNGRPTHQRGGRDGNGDEGSERPHRRLTSHARLHVIVRCRPGGQPLGAPSSALCAGV